MTLLTQIDVLRHGICEGGNIFRGCTDVPLTQQGFQQMQQALADSGHPWQCVVSSPLKRCTEFAKSLVQSGVSRFAVDERLREMSFGDWDGKEIDEVWRNDHRRISAWSLDPSVSPPPGGEALGDLAARVQSCLDDLLQQYRGQRLLLVTHGGVFRVLLSQVLGMPLACANRFDVPYACLSRLAIYHQPSGDVIKLLGHNWAAGICAND